TARVLEKGEFAVCFGVNNYFLAWSADSVAYDLLTFDIMLRYGIVNNLEFALKYSYPAAALARLKYGILKKPVAIAAEFGIGRYKMTNQAYRTDCVIDLYPGIIVEKHIYKGISLFAAPKLIYSFYIADRVGQPQSLARKTQRCYQYGYAWGIAWGNKKTSFNLENNWYWSKYEKVTYKVHQIGFGITRFFE
ncbi:MAG TPA: hypothetical protein VGD14_01450, partial [bacterium]